MKPRSLIISAFAALLLTGIPAQAAVVTNTSTPLTLVVFGGELGSVLK